MVVALLQEAFSNKTKSKILILMPIKSIYLCNIGKFQIKILVDL